MTKSPKTHTVSVGPTILCLWLGLFSSDADAYSLDTSPDRYNPNPSITDVVTDFPAPKNATIRSTKLIGGDTFAGAGALCTMDTSCVEIWVTTNGKTRYFKKEIRACLPMRGSGLLSDAATAFAARHFTAVAIPEVKNTFGDIPSAVSTNIAICGNHSFHLQYTSEGDAVSPLVCSIDAPPVVDLGELTTDTSRVVRSAVTCFGGGDASVRVSIVGPSTISPAHGLELWASAPDRPFRVTGDGAPSYVDLTVGATVHSPKPGLYSGSFVYTIEYL